MMHDIPFLTKMADMSRFMSRFVIFLGCKKSKGLCGTGQLSQVGLGRAGPTLPGPVRARARPRYFKITGPSQTRSVRFQSHAPSARPGPRDSNLAGRLPGLAREILGIFSLFVCTVSSPPPPRGFEAATCSLARARRCLWAAARCPQSAYEAESTMPLYWPSDTVGAAWVT